MRDLHLEQKSRFTHFDHFIRQRKVVPHHAPYWSVLEKPILHLFNTVTTLQSFPTLWNEGRIIPIFKKGDWSNTDNYRGIVISSCVAKWYLKILTKRFDDYMVTSCLWSQNQCGLKKDHWTEDILFVLNSIYESYVVNKNKIIYLAFVDFSKYFDMIYRKLLFYKLLKYEITGHVYHVIKSMHDDTRYRMKIRDRYSPSIWCKTGLFYEPNIVKYVSERSP